MTTDQKENLNKIKEDLNKIKEELVILRLQVRSLTEDQFKKKLDKLIKGAKDLLGEIEE